MIRSLIVDDEQDNRLTMHALLTQYCKGVEVVGEAGTVKEAVTKINELKPDLVFLDIEMPFENGFQLFKYFTDIHFEVIFTTAYDEYAVQAFRYSAIDYLLKPIDLQDLRESISRIAKDKIQPELNKIRLQTLEYNLDNSFQKIALPVVNGFEFINTADIIHLEADSNYTIVNTTNGKYVVSKTLRDFEVMLKTSNFFRVNRSHLINLKFLKRYIKNKAPLIELTNGTQIKLPLARRQVFLNQVAFMK
ncbi:MAG: LytR/AlgR family response regulator transcription factor [Saprospiraceae bacterium]